MKVLVVSEFWRTFATANEKGTLLGADKPASQAIED